MFFQAECRIISSPSEFKTLTSPEEGAARDKRSPDDSETNLSDSVKNVFNKFSKSVSDSVDNFKDSDTYHTVSEKFGDIKEKVKSVGSDIKKKIEDNLD